MIYKSYLIEGNLNKIKQKIILFYGENFGLKNTFKNEIKLINSQVRFLYFNKMKLRKIINYY